MDTMKARAAYQAKLDAVSALFMEKGISFKGNQAFADFILNDWEKSYTYSRDPTAPKPELSASITEVIQDTRDARWSLDEVIKRVFNFRAEFGLEDPVMTMMGFRSFPREEYAGCTSEFTVK